MSQASKRVDHIATKTVRFAFLLSMAASLAFLSTGCAETKGQNSNVSLQMPATGFTPRAQSENDQDFYQPPRDPQFNTALDQ
jgi:hypothetical protein